MVAVLIPACCARVRPNAFGSEAINQVDLGGKFCDQRFGQAGFAASARRLKVAPTCELEIDQPARVSLLSKPEIIQHQLRVPSTPSSLDFYAIPSKNLRAGASIVSASLSLKSQLEQGVLR